MSALRSAGAPRSQAVPTHSRPTASPRPAAPRPSRSHLQAVRTAPQANRRAQAHARARSRLYTVMSMTILILGVIGVVALNALAAEASFEARELEAAISDLTLAHDDLVAEVAMLEAPDRVREVAGSQLGLLDPEQPGFLTLRPDQLTSADPKPTIRLDADGHLIGVEVAPATGGATVLAAPADSQPAPTN